ncbi:MAG: hypothetical protein COA67_06920 [Lutibacter sp.]|nr:MAG: hypothetical protein COA67_06920 [Lutibacter sp.]
MLDQKSLELQPYQTNDILIFQSNQGEIDTIKIKHIESYVNPTDPLDVFPTKTETLFVTGNISARKIAKDIMGRPITNRHINLLELGSSDEVDYFEFTFYNPNNQLKCPTTVLSSEDLREKIESNQNEITTIKAKEYYNTDLYNIDNDLIKFNWHKELGYTKFFYKENITLELINFIRNNESIIKQKKP